MENADMNILARALGILCIDKSGVNGTLEKMGITSEELEERYIVIFTSIAKNESCN